MHLFKKMVGCGVVNAIWSLKMTEEKAKDRKRLYDKHMKHARIWEYRPMDWHTWKFKFWYKVLEWEDRDIIIEAAHFASFQLARRKYR